MDAPIANEPLHITVPATLAAVRTAADRIMAMCPCADAEQRAVYGVAVMEWLVNVVKHGYRFEASGLIRIRAAVSGNHMDLRIEDTGLGMTEERFASAPAEVRFDPANIEGLPESGMGLAIIKSVMDSVSYSSSNGINCLIATRCWR